jgi:hypothetical protein
MLQIRRIYDDIVPANREVLRQVKSIVHSRFSAVAAKEIDLIGEKLRNPFKHRFHCILFVAENLRRRVLGCHGAARAADRVLLSGLDCLRQG